jgi:hypothetical protein
MAVSRANVKVLLKGDKISAMAKLSSAFKALDRLDESMKFNEKLTEQKMQIGKTE